MDKAILVSNSLENGKRIVKALEKKRFKFNSALWSYNKEKDEWSFIIASEKLDEYGPRSTYYEIYAVLEQENLLSLIDFSSIVLLSPNDPFIKALEMIKYETDQTSEFRLTQTVFNEFYIEDAYIYKISS
ncbi:hypothetical protein [Priestia aryabhattai]